MLTTYGEQRQIDQFGIWHRALASQQGPQPLLDNLHNFEIVRAWHETKNVPFSHGSIVQAINDNTHQLEWGVSQAEQDRQRQAAEAAKAREAEVDRLVDDFCSRHQEFVKCDENLSLLVNFIKEQHKGVLGPVQLEHFWRVYQDSPELVRRASNAPPLSSGLLKPKDDWEERRADKANHLEQRKVAMGQRAAFEVALQKIAKIAVDGPRGIVWGKTAEARINALMQAADQWPQWSAECERLIAKERSRFRF